MLAVLFAFLFASASEGIGPGSELVNSEGNTLVVLGHLDATSARILRYDARRWLVCVRQGDKPPYGEFALIDRLELQNVRVLKLKPGVLRDVNPNLDAQKEPPQP